MTVKFPNFSISFKSVPGYFYFINPHLFQSQTNCLKNSSNFITFLLTFLLTVTSLNHSLKFLFFFFKHFFLVVLIPLNTLNFETHYFLHCYYFLTLYPNFFFLANLFLIYFGYYFLFLKKIISYYFILNINSFQTLYFYYFSNYLHLKKHSLNLLELLMKCCFFLILGMILRKNLFFFFLFFYNFQIFVRKNFLFQIFHLLLSKIKYFKN